MPLPMPLPLPMPKPMSMCRATLGAALLCAGAAALAQSAAAAAPVPVPAAARLPLEVPETQAFVDGLLRTHYAPEARRFAQAATALADASALWCASSATLRAGAAAPPALAGVRQAWVDTMLRWTRLEAVTTGPLLERRSEPRIDFSAFRLPALEKAITNPVAPGGDWLSLRWAMDRVGAQARGLSALEHLLWTQPAAPRTAACAYLGALARDVRDEATGLAVDFAAEAAATRSPQQAAEWFNTWANQWLGAMSRMRWREIELPVRNWGMAQAPRAASRQTAQAWATRWAALRQQSVGGPGAPAGLQPLAGYLRGRGLAAEAEALERAAAQVDAALAGASPATPPAQLLAAGPRLDGLAHVLDREVAERLAIQIEFSSNDGD